MKPSLRYPLIISAFALLALVGMLLGISSAPTSARAAGVFPSRFFAPYADITLSGPTLQSVTQSTGQKFYTLAFITNGGGSCNAEWAGTIPLNQTTTFLPHLDSDIAFVRSQGGDVIISFGGEAGQELAQTCTSATSLQAQYQAVINQYHVSRIDFDIEGGEEGDQTSYDRRNIALAALQQANPGLVISFTLPSATTGLLSTSIGLLNNAKMHGVNFSIVNLMAMDYGQPDSMMGQEAINAANGFFAQLKQIFPSDSTAQLWSMIGVTVLIGQNDSQGEIFSEANGQQLLAFAEQQNLGLLSFWEVSRDNGGCPGNTTDSDMCSGLSQGTFDFINMFKVFTTGSVGGPTPTPTTPTSTTTTTPTPTPTTPPGVQPWSGNGVAYHVGDLVSYQGSVYQCIQAHTSQPDWNPVAAPALWQLVSGGGSTPTPTPTTTTTPTPTSTTTTTPTPTPTTPPGVQPWSGNGVAYHVGDLV
ncbi:MAG TPA: carbohydrate-binding protein, partial [Ktedonobacterales bacterium]|nr:carbohydrate-binding protein [Ktedonobacterales bacterium]